MRRETSVARRKEKAMAAIVFVNGVHAYLVLLAISVIAFFAAVTSLSTWIVFISFILLPA